MSADGPQDRARQARLERLRSFSAGLPFWYGYVILACAICASFARQGAAVATLSVFVSPMTAEFGWSRAEISGAVSLGGVLGALVSPGLGRMVDRHGARVMLSASAVLVAAAALALSFTPNLAWFYVAFSLARMAFAGPFDIGITSATANWFVRQRAMAMAQVSLATGVSLAIMPLMAQGAMGMSHGAMGMSQGAMQLGDWRQGWIAIALAVLVVGALPNVLFMVRRPEDIGLVPDAHTAQPSAARAGVASSTDSPAASPAPEAAFTAAQARRTPALWLLMAYTAFIFPVQAGMSLHQAPHLVEQGISPAMAATIVATFSLSGAASSLLFGVIGARLPVRHGLALASGVTALSAIVAVGVTDAPRGFVAAVLFGAGIGGLLTLLPLAWADYFGRLNFGAIRGFTLPVQVLGQAAGPIIAGLLYDLSGSYRIPLYVFAALALAATVLVLFAVPPRFESTMPTANRPGP